MRKFTTLGCSYRLSKQYRPLKGYQAELANVLRNYMPIVPMHHERTVPGYASEALLHASRGTESSHTNGLVVGVGSLSELLGGCTDFVGYGYATNAVRTFIKHFFCWPAPSSVGDTLKGFVRDT